MTKINFSLPPAKMRPHILLLIEESERHEATHELNVEFWEKKEATDQVFQAKERLALQKEHTEFLKSKLADLK